ncbi:MAG: ABC transporter substrate-binding protein [Alphaproteobacteria bacterium]|nr:ABC transporter substrate-binding protein [Alphaproteobacteria bacterium]
MKKLLPILLLATALPGVAQANDKVTLMLDWFVNPDHAPIIIAREKGFFAEQGLDVDVVPPADPSDPPKMVAAGKADIGISYEPQLHMLADGGLPIVRVGTLVSSPLNCLLVRDDGSVKTIADLKGKKVGDSLPGFEEALLSTMLKHNGLEMKDVEVVNVNFSIAPSLMSKQVDAVIGAYRNFELNQMAIQGNKGHCFNVEDEGVPAYDELVYIANKDTLNRDVIKRFLAATKKAVAYINANKDESWKVFSATAKELQDELNKRAWGDTLPHLAADPVALDKDRYAKFQAFLKDNGLVKDAALPAGLAIDLGKE